eukprot:m.58220 g.58220  ORF g.58220 m.58220 type:complete len:565 (-) comp7854_c0_seq1:2842-4536(-)
MTSHSSGNSVILSGGDDMPLEFEVLMWLSYWEGWQGRTLVVDQHENRLVISDVVGAMDNISIPLSDCSIEAIEDKKLVVRLGSDVEYYFQASTHALRQRLVVDLSSAKIMSKSILDARALEENNIDGVVLDGSLLGVSSVNVEADGDQLEDEEEDNTVALVVQAKNEVMKSGRDIRRHLKSAQDAIASFHLPDSMQNRVRELHYTFTCLLQACGDLEGAVGVLYDVLSEEEGEEENGEEGRGGEKIKKRKYMLDVSGKNKVKQRKEQEEINDTIIAEEYRQRINHHHHQQSIIENIHQRTTHEHIQEYQEEGKQKVLKNLEHAAMQEIEAVGVPVENIDVDVEIEEQDEEIMEQDASSITVYSFFTEEKRTFFHFSPDCNFTVNNANGSLPISTADFINCTKHILPFIDALGTTFKPVRMDISSNISRLEEEYNKDMLNRSSLNTLVKHEKEQGTHKRSSSATEALLFLCRALEFVQHLLLELSDGNEDLYTAACDSYENTLKKHHNWIVKNIFSVALRALPSYSTLFPHLSLEASREQTMFEMKHFALGIGTACRSFEGFGGN